jgi:hypothetical protein
MSGSHEGFEKENERSRKGIWLLREYRAVCFKKRSEFETICARLQQPVLRFRY